MLPCFSLFLPLAGGHFMTFLSICWWMCGSVNSSCNPYESWGSLRSKRCNGAATGRGDALQSPPVNAKVKNQWKSVETM
jgi:hypothetical protein